MRVSIPSGPLRAATQPPLPAQAGRAATAPPEKGPARGGVLLQPLAGHEPPASGEGPWFTGDEGQNPAHAMDMRDASGHPHENHGLWRRQVQLSRGHWRREEASGAIRSAGWWESVTITWSPAPAPWRRPAVLQRALTAAADVVAPLLADVAVATTRRMLHRRSTRPVAFSRRRQLAPGSREPPRS
jgi:hypothetical protein